MRWRYYTQPAGDRLDLIDPCEQQGVMIGSMFCVKHCAYCVEHKEDINCIICSHPEAQKDANYEQSEV